MIEIEGKIVSADLLRDKFACDLSQCKGACCIKGDAGAPLEIEEVDITKVTPSDTDTDFVLLNIENYGQILIHLCPDAAPKTVENFKKLVSEGFYDGLTFHRVIEGFMIQGGDPSGDGTGGSEDKIEGEFSANGYDNPLSHTRGVVSMARLGHDYNSATSQFFICHDDFLSGDGQYASFGYVAYGIATVDAIAKVSTDANDKPTTSVVITSAVFVTVPAEAIRA